MAASCVKRKRSETELGSVFSSSQQLDSGCFNFDAISAMDASRRGFFATRQSPSSLLPGRTMKRCRSNRPSASEVYQHTMDVLYSAQRRPGEPQHTPPQYPSSMEAEGLFQPHAQSRHGCQQRSLHSFWNLPRPATSTNSLASSPASSSISSSSHTLQLGVPTNCEDCGACLGGDGDDVAMDGNGYGADLGDQNCGACGKAVCFSCSVSNLGEHRRCLVCARPGIGATGSPWMRR